MAARGLRDGECHRQRRRHLLGIAAQPLDLGFTGRQALPLFRIGGTEAITLVP